MTFEAKKTIEQMMFMCMYDINITWKRKNMNNDTGHEFNMDMIYMKNDILKKNIDVL